MSNQSKQQNPNPLEHKLQEFLTQVREIPRGGDLERLIEDNAAELRLLLYEVAARQRQEAATADPADFPPPACPRCQRATKPKRQGDKGQDKDNGQRDATSHPEPPKTAPNPGRPRTPGTPDPRPGPPPRATRARAHPQTHKHARANERTHKRTFPLAIDSLCVFLCFSK